MCFPLPKRLCLAKWAPDIILMPFGMLIMHHEMVLMHLWEFWLASCVPASLRTRTCYCCCSLRAGGKLSTSPPDPEQHAAFVCWLLGLGKLVACEGAEWTVAAPLLCQATGCSRLCERLPTRQHLCSSQQRHRYGAEKTAGIGGGKVLEVAGTPAQPIANACLVLMYWSDFGP